MDNLHNVDVLCQVGISVGTYDLKDNSLITLKEASMEEVRRRNEPKLAAKAGLLRDLVMRLNSQNKSVVVMIPPHGEDRIELHHHWEEIILATLKDIKFPKIRILNMAQVCLLLSLSLSGDLMTMCCR